MPFSVPTSPSSPTTPLHARRARTLFTAERGPGAFVPMAVPRRKTARPVFHISHEDDDDEDSGSPDERSSPIPSPEKIPTLSVTTTSIPFPRSGSPTSPTSPLHSPQSHLQRGSSCILLSNGKPLKSSLKSSSSAPNMPRLHLRAASEPATPAYCSTPKNVHFPDNEDSLTIVRTFNRSQRPAALLSPNVNGDETETGDESNGESFKTGRFPFPVMPPVPRFEIDPVQSATVPAPQPCHPVSPHVILESIRLPADPKPILSGSVLVRNIAYEKNVALRFTLDDWQTTSETSAKHAMSLPDLPPSLPITFPHRERDGWDRFTFSIRLEDYALTLGTRVMHLAVRYRANSAEWWDNNAGGNYKVGFRAAAAPPSTVRDRKQVVSYPGAGVSAASTSREHVAGVFTSSRPNGIRSTPAPPQVQQPGASPRTGRLSLLNYSPPPAPAPRMRSTTVSFGGSPSELATSSSTSPSKPTIDTSAPAKDSSPTSSPPSSTLNTPNVSPSLVPRVIIGGMPASGAFESTMWDHGESARSDERETIHVNSHYADWDWKAPHGDMADKAKAAKPAPTTRSASDPGRSTSPSSSSSSISSMEGLPRSRSPPRSNVDGLPPSNSSKPSHPAFSSFGSGLPADSSPSDSLYKAFVTQWCFAQGPSASNQASGIPAWRDGGILA
ncbi:carbohydrate-binding module family 21 protein [Coniophora puteana RWD-64-598 SS2]|uniref:Carbohydrate-binding module family 21 protein n=1 Tax=Coniophora puteana (strain RWD-64-598) TaxID=741705 RepID=A0A5M3N7P3_CONPW|nr:carbohydrate-binding module family 21 protein [Coniophora puteana RWD-64-598 SS2]EIW87326.1 carbohydrate-binding module family 21 protein [Coniophora puteana RWD-64-598 SS2]